MNNSIAIRTKPINPNATFPLSSCENITDLDLMEFLKNCEEICNNCEFQCMRDTTKTKLLGFCAESKLLFGSCPEYDETTRNIQVDQTTPCNINSSLSYYKSSNRTICNPDGCFTLHGTTPYLGKTTEIQKQITGGVTSGPNSNGTNIEPNESCLSKNIIGVCAAALYVTILIVAITKVVQFVRKSKRQRKKKVTRGRAKLLQEGNESQETQYSVV